MKYFNMLIKPASSNCNLRCRYCFYADVTDHRSCANYGVMSAATVNSLINCVFEHFKNENVTITFAFQGGEPTCAGLEYFINFVECVNKIKKEQDVIHYSLQTNGTLLNEEWMKFLVDNKFLVGISLDGYQKNHNKLRKDSQNRDTYELIINNINLLQKYGIAYNILSVLTSELSRHPRELYDFYKKNRFQYLQIIPCLPRLNNIYDEYALKPKEFALFYKKFFDLWYEDYIHGYSMNITFFDNIIPLFAGIPSQQCGYLGYCSPQFVVEADGSVYPCDFYVLDQYKIGNINSDSIASLSKSSILNNFIEEPHRKCKECEACRYINICHGQCKRLNINYFTDSYCGYKDFLQSKEKQIVEIASKINNNRR